MFIGISRSSFPNLRLPHRNFSPLQRQWISSSTREFKVVLDNETLYIDKPLAEALGWTSEAGSGGVNLRLYGWDPKYFVITPSGSDAERLAQGTFESAKNPRVKTVLNHLKEFDAS
ncbi:hypothetical protein ACEPAF_5718 [Sanghuangporus sanghuang]